MLQLRDARESDLDALLALLSDDPISAARGDVAAEEDRPAYLAALREITATRPMPCWWSRTAPALSGRCS